MPVMMKRSDMRPGQRFSHEGNLLTVVDSLYEVDESGCRWAFGDTAPVLPFTLAPPRAPAQPLPIVYDPQCPRDYAHEFRGWLSATRARRHTRWRRSAAPVASLSASSSGRSPRLRPSPEEQSGGDL